MRALPCQLKRISRISNRPKATKQARGLTFTVVDGKTLVNFRGREHGDGMNFEDDQTQAKRRSFNAKECAAVIGCRISQAEIRYRS